MQDITKYLSSLNRKLARGNASELTYRPVLEAFIENYKKGLSVTNEPRRIKCGAPDLLISRKEVPLGYIETKDIGIDLLHIEKDAKRKTPKTDNGKQLKRYLGSLGNLIFTDYLEFFWYRNGERVLNVRIAHETNSGKIIADKSSFDDFIKLLDRFFEEKTLKIESPAILAQNMASKAQLIRENIIAALKDKDKGGNLRGQLESFKRVLIHDLNEEQFADMYAQTICYGLFAARFNHSGKEAFTRKSAAYELPKTNPFLRKTFGHIAGPELDGRVTWLVDDLATILHCADIEAIGKDFGQRTRREDPVVHFYETFLAAYDPKKRKARGVYYTPEPVVSFIVRSVDHILKKDFSLKDGLADTSTVDLYENKKGKDGKVKKVKKGESHKVIILDPAVGTGTFLHGVIDHIHEHIVNKGQSGIWSDYVSKHLLPRIFGFELLIAPYAVAHMKLGLQLKETGYDFKTKERLGIYLTNTLEEAFDIKGLPMFDGWIAEEANKAGKVKSEKPVMVIIGNPPYSYDSENKGSWIQNLIRDYYEVDGHPLGERNPKGLQDDYVKFIRFSQWRIEQTGYGILAFVTNHGYLDNPTFRGMRKGLMNTFDDIYILDMHGNAKKKEVCPDGSKDKNVFDIQQGVAIVIYVKRKNIEKSAAKLNYAELWGVREIYKKKSNLNILVGGKYHWLKENKLDSVKWETLKPQAPFYLYKSYNIELLGEYERGIKIPDAFGTNSVGLYTSRDHFAISDSIDNLWSNIKDFCKLSVEKAREKYKLGKDVVGWKVKSAQSDLLSSDLKKSKIRKILYRPFDWRYTYYTGKSGGFICRPRNNIMKHFLDGNNLGIITVRQVAEEKFNHLYITTVPTECRITLSNKGYGYVFPLYLYPDPTKNDLFDSEDKSKAPGGRRPNLSPEFINEFEKKIKMKFIPDGKGDLKKEFGPEDIFNYMYAVFHSPTYRTRYAEFLKIDFPRLPLTSIKPLFRKLCKLGDELVGLHLMEKHGPEMTSYPIEGEHEVEKVRYTEPGQGSDYGQVWINKDQYFENVPQEIWEFHIGGYQVCHKWLKDRKGRNLSFDDIKHYMNIVSALSETIRIMKEIDKAIDKHGGWPIS